MSSGQLETLARPKLRWLKSHLGQLGDHSVILAERLEVLLPAVSLLIFLLSAFATFERALSFSNKEQSLMALGHEGPVGIVGATISANFARLTPIRFRTSLGREIRTRSPSIY